MLAFEKGSVEFDQDLLDNSEKCVETLVRVGTRVGIATGGAGAECREGEGRSSGVRLHC